MPRRATTQRSRPRKAATSPHAAQLARRIAETLPFVHFPARTRFPTFLHWERLQSHKAQGEAAPSGNFEQLRWGHVFAYAGPCCYRSSDSIGDAATYFQPSLDSAQSGAISPFDSGALEDPTPRLQPWASRTLTARWQFLRKSSVPLTGWRAEFQRWLMHCYAAPERYLDSTPDRYAAGLPDRTRPPAILQHNGPRGRSTYGEGSCADRRAWTWEARFEHPVSLVRLQALHLARDRVQEALREVSRLRFATRLSIDIKALPAGQDASADTLYEDSGRVLRQLMGL
jgi:hypothetical protein